MKSWQTTLGGIMQFLIVAYSQLSLLWDGIDTTNPDWNLFAASLVTLLAFFKSRDNNVTSEAAGAK